MNIRKSILLLTAALIAGTLHAQVPDTPAGRQFLAWQKAQDSADRATIQQFIDKNMPWSNVDQALALQNQTGGLDVKRVEQSSDTSIVVLAQQRGGARQFMRITLGLAADPNRIAGLRIQPAETPPDLAPPKMTASEQAAARTGAPFRQFSAWLDAFNSADRERIRKFIETSAPSINLDGQMNFRERTGGLELRALEQASPTSLVGLVQERGSDQFGRFTVVIEPGEPHRITQLPISAIARPAEFPIAALSEKDLVTALRTKVEKDTAADAFSGTVLLAKDGKALFTGAYGLADRDRKVANTLDTRFRIGSMNKMFTAVAVLQLVQAGKIRLAEPLGKYVADYPNKDVATKVTIHQLLTHTGGTGDFFGPEFNAHRLELQTHSHYVALFGNRGPVFEPGSRWAYSNYGMLLLGVVIERVTGQSYYDYVADHIYKPAGMTSSGSAPESQAVPNRSVGYMKAQGAEYGHTAASRNGCGWRLFDSW